MCAKGQITGGYRRRALSKASIKHARRRYSALHYSNENCLFTYIIEDKSFKLLTNYYKLFHFRTNETSQDLKITDNDLKFKKVHNYKLLQLSYFPYFYNWIRAPIKD